MEEIIKQLKIAILDILKSFDVPSDEIKELNIENTNKDHIGDLTLVVFPISKLLKCNPEELANRIGTELIQRDHIKEYNVIKGFLNILLKDHDIVNAYEKLLQKAPTGFQMFDPNSQSIVIEYCGPNTNKPLHIGHLRNMFLGFSMSRILQAYGNEVHKVNIYNDRGIAICKSMIAWKLYGKGETPASSGMKGDFLVGKYYVLFNEVLKQEKQALIDAGTPEKDAENQTPILKMANELLLQWEEGEQETIDLWNQMNQWVYEGFKITFDRLKIDFEKEYYESQEYQKGKDIVQLGLDKGVFETDETGAVFADLTDMGLDKKILQRANGTSIYITQDMALVEQRFKDYQMDKMIYVVGDEQNYHFKALQGISKKLDNGYADAIEHLSYGMVVSKDGSKFKSREGNAADADDIIESVVEEAKNQTIEHGKSEEMGAVELDNLSETIGIGALRFAMLRVNPKKKILFDPRESIDIHGDTSTFIQYSFARTNSILKKFKNHTPGAVVINNQEVKNLLLLHMQYGEAIKEAATQYDPSAIAQYAINLAKTFNRFYNEHSLLNEKDETIVASYLTIVRTTNQLIEKSLHLLGIESPERM